MKKAVSRRTFMHGMTGVAALAGAACALPRREENEPTGSAPASDAPASSQTAAEPAASAVVEEILASMSLEQKVAQLIMPAIRTWEGLNVTDLAAVPGLAEALRRHQYGGVILFGSNVIETDQTVRLVAALQANNAQGEDAAATRTIPYYVAADQEGGSVARLAMGTRGTGSMAIGATGGAAEQNALATGTIFGEELNALGINVNLAPCVDIITDLADLGMSTRVFSDNPDAVHALSQAFADGVSKSEVITCFKHFPGAGDGSDDPTAVGLTLDELRAQGLIPYAAVVRDGAEMVMTSACTFPSFDDTVVLADGVTEGYYPATMSQKIVNDLLRDELGYNGVVMTDALEMEQFVVEPQMGVQILPGAPHSVEAGINIAEKCLTAGCDILLIPCDLNSAYAAQWYEEYVTGIANRVRMQDSANLQERVDESVRRILSLKEKRGILELDTTGEGVDEAIAAAQEIVGSAEHHAVERDIAEQAVTLLKNDDALPVPGTGGAHVVLLGRTAADAVPIRYAMNELMEKGYVDPEAYVVNCITGEVLGDPGATEHVFVDHYYDANTGMLTYSAQLSAAIASADYVVCLSAVGAGVSMLQDTDARMQGITRALAETHEAGAKFVLLSDNVPVDAARFPQADAIVCCYLSAGFDIDPTTGSGTEHTRAINANVPAALRAIFGVGDMPGRLPIDVKELRPGDDGMWGYTDEVLYARGTGLG